MNEVELLKAIGKEDLELVTRLVEGGADVNWIAGEADVKWLGDPPLCCAARLRNVDILRYLIEKGANVNLADIGGNTPLYGAVVSGRVENARFLIQKGANTDIWEYEIGIVLGPAGEDSGLRTPPRPKKSILDVVFYGLASEELRKRRVEMATLLLENGASAHAVNCCPLEEAITMKSNELLRLLIQKGADANETFTYGGSEFTPLGFAIKFGHEEVFKVLLENHANVGRKEVDLACEKHMYRYLKRAMKELEPRRQGSWWWPF